MVQELLWRVGFCRRGFLWFKRVVGFLRFCCFVGFALALP
jgi:hypothetical protein